MSQLTEETLKLWTKILTPGGAAMAQEILDLRAKLGEAEWRLEHLESTLDVEYNSQHWI